MNVQPSQLPTETHKHTPGPWEIRSRHESRMDHTTVIRSVAIPGHDYIEVSRLTDPTPAQDLVARANVRLIASSPELLELAKDYAGECADCDGTGIADTWEDNVPGDITKGVHKATIDCPQCADIRAVIAKAEGADHD